MGYVSLHGNIVGFNEAGLLFKGRPVGQYPLPVGGRGKVVYVDSAVGGSDGFSPETALAALDSAFDRVRANMGDVIAVMPGHSETIVSAGAIAHDVAGVAVVGVGYGSLRPKITYGTSAAATYAITADGARVEGLIFESNVSNAVAAITTTKKDTTIVGNEFRNAGANKDFLTPIKATSTTDNDSDGLFVADNRWLANDSDDLEFIEINATLDRFQAHRNFMFSLGTASPLILCAAGKLLTQAHISYNRVFNAMTANELFISNDGTTNTGILHDNYVGHKDVSGTHDAGWDGGGFRLFNNLSTSVDNLSGFVVPAIDVNL